MLQSSQCRLASFRVDCGRSRVGEGRQGRSTRCRHRGRADCDQLTAAMSALFFYAVAFDSCKNRILSLILRISRENYNDATRGDATADTARDVDEDEDEEDPTHFQ